MPFLDELLQSIDNRIREVNGEIESLEEARSALVTNGSASAPSRTTQARQPAQRKARRRRARKTTILLADAAERMLAESGGMTTAALAKEAAADRDQVLALLRDLETARRIRRTGERRATRWHAVTDEDRIRERANELANRSRRRRS